MKRKMLQFLERIAAGSRLECSRLLLSIMLLLWMSTPAEGDCLDETLNGIDADTLLMDSQEVYRLLDDPRAVIFWLPLSKVTICDQVSDVGDEDYYEIRNQDENQMVRAMRER